MPPHRSCTRCLAKQAPNLRGLGNLPSDNERARAELNRMAARIRDRLPDYVAKGCGADTDWIQHAFEMWLETTFPTLLAPADNVLPFPPKKDDDDAL